MKNASPAIAREAINKLENVSLTGYTFSVEFPGERSHIDLTQQVLDQCCNSCQNLVQEVHTIRFSKLCLLLYWFSAIPNALPHKSAYCKLTALPDIITIHSIHYQPLVQSVQMGKELPKKAFPVLPGRPPISWKMSLLRCIFRGIKRGT